MVEGESLEPGEQAGEAWGRDHVLEKQVRQTCPAAALTLPIRNLVEQQTTDIWENLLRPFKCLWFGW